MLDVLRLDDVANHTNLTRIKGLYITPKLSRYSVYTSNIFNGIVTDKFRQASSSNSHKCKPSQKNLVNNPKVGSLLLTVLFQIFLPCIVNFNKHTDLTQIKGLYIPSIIIQLFSVHLKLLQQCFSQQGQVGQRNQQSQVKTVNRRNTKSTIQRQVVFY